MWGHLKEEKPLPAEYYSARGQESALSLTKEPVSTSKSGQQMIEMSEIAGGLFLKPEGPKQINDRQRKR